MKLLRSFVVVSALLLLVLVVACAPKEEAPVEEEVTEVTEQPVAAPIIAVATLTGREGTEITGSVSFTPVGDGVQVLADLGGVEAAGPHGLHIHEVGDCSAADFTSARGHFNPTGAVHGCPGDPEHHAGDLGNIEIAADGSGRLEISSSMIGVEGGASNSVIGRAVILHADADDCASQPTGNAGGRLACGVITLQGEAGGEMGESGAGD